MAVGVVLKQLGAVDGADAQLPLHRRDERRALEQGPGQRLQGARHLGQTPFRRTVQTCNAYVLLTSTLLRLDQASGTVDAHDEVARYFWVQGSRVARLLYAQHAPQPSHHFVGAGVGGFVQVDASVTNVLLERPLEWVVAHGDGGVVPGAHDELVIVLEKKRPLGRVESRRPALWFDHEVAGRLLLPNHFIAVLVAVFLLLLLLLLFFLFSHGVGVFSGGLLGTACKSR
mmetsp:Transcript_19054/g.36388  ORF Transcript_19054/g.36388 Transcript_19054/m.36388 type:complete len:229 (-) Transcript_19054:26-712(-)